jgi:hypothetical protein
MVQSKKYTPHAMPHSSPRRWVDEFEELHAAVFRVLVLGKKEEKGFCNLFFGFKEGDDSDSAASDCVSPWRLDSKRCEIHRGSPNPRGERVGRANRCRAPSPVAAHARARFPLNPPSR